MIASPASLPNGCCTCDLNDVPSHLRVSQSIRGYQSVAVPESGRCVLFWSDECAEILLHQVFARVNSWFRESSTRGRERAIRHNRPTLQSNQSLPQEQFECVILCALGNETRILSAGR